MRFERRRVVATLSILAGSALVAVSFAAPAGADTRTAKALERIAEQLEHGQVPVRLERGGQVPGDRRLGELVAEARRRAEQVESDEARRVLREIIELAEDAGGSDDGL